MIGFVGFLALLFLGVCGLLWVASRLLPESYGLSPPAQKYIIGAAAILCIALWVMRLIGTA